MNEQKSTQNLDEVGKWPEMPPEMPGEWFRRISLRPGLELMLVDLQPQKNFVFSVEIHSSPLEIGCFLSGSVQTTLIRSRGQKDNFNCAPGQSSLSFYPNSRGSIEFLAGQSIRAVTIGISPRLLGTFIDSQSDHIPAHIRGVVDGSNKDYYNRPGTITASMHMVIHQILNCPYQGATQRLFYESKVLELIAHFMADMAYDGTKSTLRLRPCDQERVHHARQIVLDYLEHPPSLIELARQVGMNVTKLKRAFRQMYGTTVFGYLRVQRMQLALELLEEGKKNVTEVAYAVGYSSLSQFAAAFSKHFGAKPSSYLKQVLQRSFH